MGLLRRLVLGTVLFSAAGWVVAQGDAAAFTDSRGGPARVTLPSSTSTGVTVYGASWCGPCHILERGLKERDIPFEEIDVDRNPDAFSRAKQATGSSGIPQTNVVRGSQSSWIVGADVDGVERAYRGN